MNQQIYLNHPFKNEKISLDPMRFFRALHDCVCMPCGGLSHRQHPYHNFPVVDSSGEGQQSRMWQVSMVGIHVHV